VTVFMVATAYTLNANGDEEWWAPRRRELQPPLPTAREKHRRVQGPLRVPHHGRGRWRMCRRTSADRPRTVVAGTAGREDADQRCTFGTATKTEISSLILNRRRRRSDGIPLRPARPPLSMSFTHATCHRFISPTPDDWKFSHRPGSSLVEASSHEEPD
jgi:hypothetical protein